MLVIFPFYQPSDWYQLDFAFSINHKSTEALSREGRSLFGCFHSNFQRRELRRARLLISGAKERELSKERWEVAMARLGGADSSSFSSPSLLSGSSVFQNHPLISALVAFALAQSIKFFTTWYLLHHAKSCILDLALSVRFSFPLFS